VVSTFTQRIEDLRRQVGTGHISAHCVVDQAYAQNQHQTVTFVHRHGGRAFYLGAPLMENWMILMWRIAEKCITATGSEVEGAMIETAEWMAQAVFENAPRKIAELATSGHPFVLRNGSPVYDRPPVSPRRPPGAPHV
jgi:hypothetical protein